MTSDVALAVEHALALAYAHLNRRDRTVEEMREHLFKRGVQEDVVEAAVAELCQQGYLDDHRFARLFVQDKRNLEQWGNDRIRRGLTGRSVPEEIVEASLSETVPPDGAGGDAAPTELERALELLERRFPAGLSDRRESERALGVLLRKGYEYELAAAALSEHRRRVGRA